MARRPRRFLQRPALEHLIQDTAKRACRKAEFTAVHASADAYRESESWQGRPKGNYSHEGKVCQPALPCRRSRIRLLPQYNPGRYVRMERIGGRVHTVCHRWSSCAVRVLLPAKHDSTVVRRQALGVTNAAGGFFWGSSPRSDGPVVGDARASSGHIRTAPTARRAMTRPLWARPPRPSCAGESRACPGAGLWVESAEPRGSARRRPRGSAVSNSAGSPTLECSRRRSTAFAVDRFCTRTYDEGGPGWDRPRRCHAGAASCLMT